MQRKYTLVPVLAALVVGAVGGAVAAGSDPEGTAFHISRRLLLQEVATTRDGLAMHPLPTGPDATVLQLRRDRSGEVEVHKAKHDLIIAQEGGAVILVGGTVSGAREIAPGEWRGGTIKDAKPYPMIPGDVLWIPAGQPHRAVLPENGGGSFSYLAAKFDAKR